MAAERHLVITLPADTPNTTYAALANTARHLLALAGLTDRAEVHVDQLITSTELNAVHRDTIWADRRERW